MAVGEEAEVADADEAAWQQVQKEATQELIDRQAHDALLVAVGGVSPAKAYVALGKSNEPAVGDGDAVGVGAEITQGMFRSAEGSLGVDDPVVTIERSEQGAKLGGSASDARWPWNSSLPSWNAVFRPATNLPRKTRPSTLTGRKKDRREEIQPE